VKRVATALTLLAAFALITGCVATTSPPKLDGRSPPHAAVTISDRADGQTVVLHTAQLLRVVLGSTYWTFQPPTNETVLSPHNEAQVIPRLSQCVPGGGCGSVVQVYEASSIGRSVVTATRTSCGEAMGCTAASGRFAVVVVVRR
jgi:hypothetical protein